MPVQEESINIATRHQVQIEGFKAGNSRDWAKTIDKVTLAAILQVQNLGIEKLNELPKSELNKLIAAIRESTKGLLDKEVESFVVQMERFAASEATFEVQAINTVT